MHSNTDQCKLCAFRFRRVFIPAATEEFVDDEGNVLDIDSDNIMIMNLCLLTGMDIGGESTIECCYFREKDSVNIQDMIPLFRINRL
jgi:hypothetical protein